MTKKVSFVTEIRDIVKKYYHYRHTLEDELKKRLKDLQTQEYDEIRVVESKCLEVNGSHVDDGGMFYATCANCGFCDDFYGCDL